MTWWPSCWHYMTQFRAWPRSDTDEWSDEFSWRLEKQDIVSITCNKGIEINHGFKGANLCWIKLYLKKKRVISLWYNFVNLKLHNSSKDVQFTVTITLWEANKYKLKSTGKKKNRQKIFLYKPVLEEKQISYS